MQTIPVVTAVNAIITVNVQIQQLINALQAVHVLEYKRFRLDLFYSVFIFYAKFDNMETDHFSLAYDHKV